MIKILLADDHEILRTGLKFYINSILTDAVIHEASDADSVIEKIKGTGYDLIVLDTNMHGKESYKLVSDIISIIPEANILIFGMYLSDINKDKYIMLGAKGYISKTALAEEIKNAIKTILKNNDC